MATNKTNSPIAEDDLSSNLGDEVQEPTAEDLAELNGNFTEPDEDYGGVLDEQTSLTDEQNVNEEVINDNTLGEVDDDSETIVTNDVESDRVFVTDSDDLEDEVDEEEKKTALIDEIQDEKFDDEFEEDEE